MISSQTRKELEAEIVRWSHDEGGNAMTAEQRDLLSVLRVDALSRIVTALEKMFMLAAR